MLISNAAEACKATGFVEVHASACQSVANRMRCIIMFRAPGTMAQGLIKEGYAMKGFRIDTKSCTWGPMAGFVCVDPRLTKGDSQEEVTSFETRNAVWTKEALHGEISEKFFGKVDDASWVADVMPIVLSSARIKFLEDEGMIATRKDGNDLVGESRNVKTTLHWRLVRVGNATNTWLMGASDHYVLCVNTRAPQAFRQQYPGGSKPVMFRGHETVLGLINPGTRQRAYKACITADYDLFATWPKAGPAEGAAMQHLVNAAVLAKAGNSAAPVASTVARMPGVDDRLQSQGLRESHRFGDVSTRVMLIKTMLNTALIAEAGYDGGNAIHHNDEAGNFALAKGSLASCLPLIGFYGGFGTVLISTLADFKELVLKARSEGFDVRAKPEWLIEAGCHTAS